MATHLSPTSFYLIADVLSHAPSPSEYKGKEQCKLTQTTVASFSGITPARFFFYKKKKKWIDIEFSVPQDQTLIQKKCLLG